MGVLRLLSHFLVFLVVQEWFQKDTPLLFRNKAVATSRDSINFRTSAVSHFVDCVTLNPHQSLRSRTSSVSSDHVLVHFT